MGAVGTVSAVEAGCRNMVEQQIRTWEVLDDRVLDLYYDIPRVDFVPEEHRGMAWADAQLPIGSGQVMLEPKVEARMLQELAPSLVDKVAHVGTGTGFFAALLSRLCGSLTTFEIMPPLAEDAGRRLAEHGVTNARVVCADALDGPLDGAPYDAVVLTGTVPEVPDSILESLGEHGRLVAPVGSEPVCTVRRVTRAGSRRLDEDLFETWVPWLENVKRPSGFFF